ncbi:Uncharacterised protein [Campylobacter helveticus]|nr:Uncharacterised protein [Campylobacter helveticus]
MKPLRIIYIVWLVFGTILSLYGFFYMIFSDKSFLESFSLAILILLIFSILPLLPYFYYLIYDKARKIKNLFVAICCYLLLFVVAICCCLLLLAISLFTQ